MSFAVWDTARKFAIWRYNYLKKRPQAKLWPWLKSGSAFVWQGMEGLVGSGEEGEERKFITITPKGENIIRGTKIKGIVLVGIVLLALAGRE